MLNQTQFGIKQHLNFMKKLIFVTKLAAFTIRSVQITVHHQCVMQISIHITPAQQ
jgi:hypothetical protein